ncbi:MAG: hypothetical protein WAM85_25025 [Terracidiphilus sp.]
MSLRVAILLVLATPVAFAQSPQVCPWLSAGTAANALAGRNVTIVAHSDSNWSGRCVFTDTTDPGRTVEVLVGKMDPHSCKSDATPLTGIGNQAEFCSHRDANGQQVQTVTGRVRDAWFVVTMATQPAAGNQLPDDVSAPDIRFLAEQVAGNLY